MYSFLQNIAFFFIYCFLGWIWETCYVSLRVKHFVNRGFLHGPMIPIYGFGAMAILIFTIPVKNNLVLVFIFGMIGASLLELVTGCVMEAIFHVRYWDYSHIPTNVRGYISLPTSLVWGLFSVLMIKYIHVPIERFVLGLSQFRTELATTILVSIGSMDFALSVREALDLKEILARITENEKVVRAQNRVDMIVALIDNDVENLRERLNDRIDMLGKGEYKRIRSILERNPSARSKRYEDIFEHFRDAVKDWKKD